jgi:hypothetical protein
MVNRFSGGGSERVRVYGKPQRRGTQGRPSLLSAARQQRTGDTVYQSVQVHEDSAYRRVAFLEGVLFAGLKTFETSDDTLGVVGKLFSGRVSVRQLQSVVGISRAAGQAVHKGAQAVISLMVLISVNLGILNLLPIPILDGGNILLLAIEGGLRRDLSMAFKERFVQVGLVFLLVLFAIVMYNDLARLLGGHPELARSRAETAVCLRATTPSTVNDSIPRSCCNLQQTLVSPPAAARILQVMDDAEQLDVDQILSGLRRLIRACIWLPSTARLICSKNMA